MYFVLLESIINVLYFAWRRVPFIHEPTLLCHVM